MSLVVPGNKATLGWYESTRAGGKELFGMHGALQIVELIPINKQKVDSDDKMGVVKPKITCGMQVNVIKRG